MKRSGAAVLAILVINIFSLNAQPLRLGSIPIASNKKSELRPLKKRDFISPEEDLKEEVKSERKSNKEYKKLHQKEIRKTQKQGRKNKHLMFARKPKEETGL